MASLSPCRKLLIDNVLQEDADGSCAFANIQFSKPLAKNEALPYGKCSTSAPQNHATGCLLGFEQAPCIQILLRPGIESSTAHLWQRSGGLARCQGSHLSTRPSIEPAVAFVHQRQS